MEKFQNHNQKCHETLKGKKVKKNLTAAERKRLKDAEAKAKKELRDAKVKAKREAIAECPQEDHPPRPFHLKSSLFDLEPLRCRRALTHARSLSLHIARP